MSEAKEAYVMNILATVFEGLKMLVNFITELYAILNEENAE